MKREVTSFSLGLALGAVGVAIVQRSVALAPATNVAKETRPLSLRAAAPWTAPRVLDPAQADARLQAWLASEAADEAALRRLLPILPSEKFPELAEALLRRKAGKAREAFQTVFDAWVERDAAGAARWSGGLADDAGLNGSARRLLREQAGLAWARDDLSGALAWAHSLPDASGEWSAAARIYGQLAEREPQRALALLRARGDEAFLKKAAKRVYDGWSTRDPASALQGLGDTLFEGGLTLLHLSLDIGRWVGQDPDAALRWVVAHERGQENYASNLFYSLAKDSDAAVLLPALLRATHEAPQVELMSWPLQAWMRSDPSATKAWLDGLDADLRGKLLHRAAGSYSVDRPWENLGLALLLPAGAERNEIIVARVGEWFELDPDAALAWLNTHDAPAASAAIQAKLIGRLAETDRPAALVRLGTLAPGQEKRVATRTIAAAWAKSAPAEAAEWLAAAARSRTESYDHQDWGAVVRPWFKQDPVRVREWIDAQPDASLRGEAGSAWILEILNSPLSHRERAELVAGVKEEQRQRQDMLNVAAHWFGVDEPGARAWIEASTLPELTKKILIEAYGKKAPTR